MNKIATTGTFALITMIAVLIILGLTVWEALKNQPFVQVPDPSDATGVKTVQGIKALI